MSRTYRQADPKPAPIKRNLRQLRRAERKAAKALLRRIARKV